MQHFDLLPDLTKPRALATVWQAVMHSSFLALLLASMHLPLLDKVVHLVAWLERHQALGQLRVQLGLGLADLAVVRLDVPAQRGGCAANVVTTSGPASLYACPTMQASLVTGSAGALPASLLCISLLRNSVVGAHLNVCSRGSCMRKLMSLTW